MTLQARSLSFSFSSEQQLISDLHLSLRPGAKIALTGPNGSGKTTLLRLLAGKCDPDDGTILGSSKTELLEQHLLAGGSAASGGELRIAALRRVLTSGVAVILLDEPTNDLDKDAREWLKQAVSESASSIVLASHDPMILDLVEEIWELKQGRIVKHPPGFHAYIKRLDEEEARLRLELDSLRSEARRMRTHAKEIVEAQKKRMSRGRKAAVRENMPKVIRGARERQAQVTLARVTAVQEDRAERVRIQMLRAQQRLRNLSVFEWDSSATLPPATRLLIRIKDAILPGFRRQLNFEMRGPKRVHLKGRNGSGKSTLLRALCGDPDAKARCEGQFHLAAPFQIFDQGLSQYTSTSPLWKWFLEKTRLDVSMARTILGRLGFEQREQLRPVCALSGGERVRLEIALALHAHEPPQVLLLDEPSNHLDLESRRILQHFLAAFKGGMVVVTHDAALLASIKFDEVIDLESAGY